MFSFKVSLSLLLVLALGSSAGAAGELWVVVSVFQVGQGYPHDPPKVKCETMVYHPNIDLEGNVCLNILRWVLVVDRVRSCVFILTFVLCLFREDWKPVLTINSIIYGLQYLFLVSFLHFHFLPQRSDFWSEAQAFLSLFKSLSFNSVYSTKITITVDH